MSNLEFIRTVGNLKSLKRTGWVDYRIKNSESVADHSFRVSVMALTLAPKAGLDAGKCLQLGIVHDLAESVVGDKTPLQITKEEKRVLEEKAIREFQLPQIIDLWLEYEDEASPEAEFVNQIDKLETFIQLIDYEKENKLHMHDIYAWAKKKVTHPVLVKVLEEADALRLAKSQEEKNYRNE